MRPWLRTHLTFANVCSLSALFVALGGTTYAATGGNFILGQPNTAGQQTSLTASPSFAGKALQLTNTNTGAGARALGLSVASGHPPFTVNSGTKVTSLNADRLDGQDRSQLPAVHYGVAPQDEVSADGHVVIQWFDLGASIRTDGDADSDNTLEVHNTRSSGNIRVLWGTSSLGAAPGASVVVDANTTVPFIVRNDDGSRSWLVVCGVDFPTTNLRCHGVASQGTG
jgi:hypothetical protein